MGDRERVGALIAPAVAAPAAEDTYIRPMPISAAVTRTQPPVWNRETMLISLPSLQPFAPCCNEAVRSCATNPEWARKRTLQQGGVFTSNGNHTSRADL